MGAVVELEMTDLRPARCHKHNVYVVYVATAIDVVGGSIIGITQLCYASGWLPS